MIVARLDASGRYTVPASGDRASMSFTHAYAAARVGLVIAGEIVCEQPPPAPAPASHTVIVRATARQGDRRASSR